MKKSLIALAVAGAISVPAIAQEAASPHTFTGNVTIASDYVFRGISQTQGKPALQGGFDYEHSSGLYAGTWASNVGWVDGVAKDNNSLEWDFYAGYKNSVGPVSYDLGVLRYTYPGDKRAGTPVPDSTEVYVALGWEFLELKYSHAVSSHLFGWVSPTGERSRGSEYLELNASYELDGGWGLSAHVGNQKIKNYAAASYTDWGLGVSKDVGFGTVALNYSDSDAKGDCGSTQPYCFGANQSKNAARARTVLSFSKSF